jgi:phage-related protein
MKMQDLADAFGTGLLASIKGFGVSIQDAGAALATFGDNNIRGADAGTKLRQAIQALAAPTGAGKKILEGWGLSANRFAKDMQKGGLRKALEDLQAQFKKVGLSGKEQGQVLTELFGKRAGVGIQILIGQMGRFESKFTDLNKGANRFGDAWKKTQATASQQFKELTQGLVAIGVKIGEKLLPPLMDVFGFIRSNTGLVLTFAGVIGGLALAISAVSFAIKIAEAAQKLWTAAMWLFDAATSANPIGATIILIGVLVTAIVLLWKHASWFRTAVEAVWGALKTAFDAVWSTMKIVAGAVRAAFDAVWGALKTAFDAVWGALKTVFSWIHEHWKLLAAILFGPIGLAVDAIVTHWPAVKHVFEDLWHWLKDAWNAVYDYIISPIVKAIKLVIGTEIKLLIAGFKIVWSWLKTAWQFVYDYIVKPIGKAAVFIFNTWKAILTGVANLIIKIKNFFAPAITWLVNAGKNVIRGLFGGMWHEVQGAWDWVARIGGKILHAVTSFFGIKSPSTVFFGIGGNLIKGLFKGMVHGASGLATWVIREIEKIGGSVLGGLLNLFGGSGGGGSPPGGATALQRFAGSLFGGYGWSPRELGPLIELWNQESGWNPRAQNPTSGAYGIPQALPASKMASAGADWRTNADTQIRWGLSYIKGRYGDPAGAWAHEQAFNWYGGGLQNGLFTRPTLIGVGERGPELVNITPAGRGGGGVSINVYVNGIITNPRETGRQVADALNQAATGGVRLRKSLISANG